MPARPPQPSDDDEEEDAVPAITGPPASSNTGHHMSRQSRTTDDIPDEVQRLLSQHSSPTKSPGDGYVPLDQMAPARRPGHLAIQPTTPTDEHMYLPMNKQNSATSVQSNTLNGSQGQGNPRLLLFPCVNLKEEFFKYSHLCESARYLQQLFYIYFAGQY